jgi:hypothetical protein
MRASIVAKFLGLVAVGAVASGLTSAILAQSGSSKQRGHRPRATGIAAAVPIGDSLTPNMTVMEGNPTDPEAPNQFAAQKPDPFAAGCTARFQMGKMSATVIGTQVSVNVNVSIQAKQTGALLLWTLRVFDAKSKERISEHRYVDQMFWPETEALQSPTFSETLTLPPGTYVTEVILYRLHRGVTVDRLNLSPEIEESLRVLDNRATVIVNPL